MLLLHCAVSLSCFPFESFCKVVPAHMVSHILPVFHFLNCAVAPPYNDNCTGAMFLAICKVVLQACECQMLHAFPLADQSKPANSNTNLTGHLTVSYVIQNLNKMAALFSYTLN